MQKGVCKDLEIKNFRRISRFVCSKWSITVSWCIKDLDITDIDMLLMVEKGIRGGMCHSFYLYAKPNNKYVKDYYKDKESSYTFFFI